MAKARFCKLVAEAIDDEAKAVKEYGTLMGLIPVAAKKTVKRIRADEKGHRDALLRIKRRFCRA